MAKLGKVVGTLLMVVGLAVCTAFGWRAANDPDYDKAALLLERNKGNAMYEIRYAGAAIRRGFLIYASVGGGLLALNGATLVMVGVLAGRVQR